MFYLDSHVHLNDDSLFNEIDNVIKNAKINDVNLMFVVGWDLESSKKAVSIADSNENIYAIVGFHPCNIKNYSDNEYNELEELIKSSKKVIAVGEIGYDFHWDDTTKEEQEIAFEKQINIAARYHLPISIHSREADSDTFMMIKKHYKELSGGVLHAYSGSSELAKEYIKMGFIFGVGGVVTFKNARRLVEVVENIDLKYLISETDSPYLTPTPYRGERNEPKYIPLIVKKISEIKQLDIEIVKTQIYENVKRVFKI